MANIPWKQSWVVSLSNVSNGKKNGNNVQSREEDFCPQARAGKEKVEMKEIQGKKKKFPSIVTHSTTTPTQHK